MTQHLHSSGVCLVHAQGRFAPQYLMNAHLCNCQRVALVAAYQPLSAELVLILSISPLQMAATMDQFERQFENLDVQSEFVENAMGNQATLSTPEEDVNLLLQQARGDRLRVRFRGACLVSRF